MHAPRNEEDYDDNDEMFDRVRPESLKQHERDIYSASRGDFNDEGRVVVVEVDNRPKDYLVTHKLSENEDNQPYLFKSQEQHWQKG